MSQTLGLKMEVRKDIGSKPASRLRCDGKLPAIVYGHRKEPITVTMNRHDFTEALHHGHRLFDAELDGRKETVLVKALQYDYLGKDIIHVDLIRVDLSETIRVTVPIKQVGTSKGSHEGGMIDEILDHLEIECRVSEIPEVILISVKEVGVGDSVHARDVQLPAGAKLITDSESLVLHCHTVAAAKTTEELEAEAPAAPEVIGEVKEEEPAEPSE
ncbi:MAG: 50S ribosomal protein L25 [Sedimentisphaerales bacterium]|nr:50S ribosomal protein L25 [Sedimentisphaerales bacterium]